MSFIMQQEEPFPNRQVLDLSKLEEFADDTFKFDENGRNLSRWVENIVGKGEIARHEQFLLFPRCFQKLKLQTHKKQGLFEKGLNPFSQSMIFIDLSKCLYIV